MNLKPAMTFTENLAGLPEAQGRRLRLFDKQDREVAVIENAPGTAWSFRVYAYLAGKYGAINVGAAQEGLLIYAEHTEDARQYPGKHPNIDRLFDVLQMGSVLRAEQE